MPKGNCLPGHETGNDGSPPTVRRILRHGGFPKSGSPKETQIHYDPFYRDYKNGAPSFRKQPHRCDQLLRKRARSSQAYSKRYLQAHITHLLWDTADTQL